MATITAVANAAYQAVHAYIRQNGNDVNSIQAQLIITALNITITATGTLPQQEVPAGQRAERESPTAEVVQEGTGLLTATASTVTNASLAVSNVASSTSAPQLAGVTISRTANVADSNESQAINAIASNAAGAETAPNASATQPSPTAARSSTPVTTRTASLAVARSTPVSTNTSRSESTNTSGASTTRSSGPTTSATAPAPVASTATTHTSNASGNVLVQIYAPDGYEKTCDVPASYLQGFNFGSSLKCFQDTNKLCKWLHEKAAPYPELRREFNIRTFNDYSKSMNGEPLFKIEPTAALKEMAKLVKRKGVTINRSTLDKISELVKYRCALTDRYLLVPTQRDSDLDNDNKKHVFFNKAIAEVYDILRTLPST